MRKSLKNSDHNQRRVDAELQQLKLPPVSPQALRHTRASQLIASGMGVLTISRRLRHGSPITLNICGHLFSSSDDKAADVIERASGKILLANENTVENASTTN